MYNFLLSMINPVLRRGVFCYFYQTLSIMKKLSLFISLLFSTFFFAQTFIDAYQQRANLVSQQNLNNYLSEFVALGVKKTGTAANNNAFEWLKGKYQSFGYTAESLSENSFTYQGQTTKNLIVTKVGTKYPNTYIIVCGHYDTIGGAGANDNGSGVSVILEMARILRDVPTDYSIKFINFSGEEQGLLGSGHYVNTVVNGTTPKMDIRLVLNIDQVGGVAGQINNTVTCERDVSAPVSNNTASDAATRELMTCVGLYSPLQTHLANAYASDYMPFQSNGEAITGLFEYNESNVTHTSADTISNLDPVYIFNISKAAVGALQHFARATTAVLGTDCTPEEMVQSLKIYPNPARDVVHIELLNATVKNFTFTITDPSGRMLIQTKNELNINVSSLLPGVYFGAVSVDDAKSTKKIVIAR